MRLSLHAETPTEPPFLIANMPCVRALLAAENAPLGEDATTDLYRHQGATEPYRGGFSPKTREANAPPSDRLPEYEADPDTDYQPDAPFTDEENHA